MKLLSRYIFKELLPMFIIGNVFFLILLLLERMIQLTDLLFTKDVAFVLILKTVLLLLPSLLFTTIPLAAMLAVMLAFSRFSSDHELVAFKSVGANNRDIILPVVFFAIFAAILGILISVLLIGKSSQLAVNNLNKITENISIKDIRENEIYENLPGILLYVTTKQSDTDFRNVIVVYKNNNTIITAERAHIAPTPERSIEMVFDDGRLTLTSNDKKASLLSFQKMTINLPLNINISEAINSPLTMDMPQLYAASKKDKGAAYELSKRIALPVATLILSLFGFALGGYATRSGRSSGLILATLISLVFYFMLIYLENIAKRGMINPFFAAWISNIIFAIILIPVLRKSIK